MFSTAITNGSKTVTIKFPTPCDSRGERMRPWSINQERSNHYSWRSKRAAAWRLAACEAMLGWPGGGLGRCQVEVDLPVTNKVRRDPANFGGASKAIIDGLVDAGLWPDDTSEYVLVVTPTLTIDPDLMVWVRLTETAYQK